MINSTSLIIILSVMLLQVGLIYGVFVYNYLFENQTKPSPSVFSLFKNTTLLASHKNHSSKVGLFVYQAIGMIILTYGTLLISQSKYSLLSWTIFFVFTYPMIWIDAKKFILPNLIIYPLFLIGLVVNSYHGFIGVEKGLTSGILIFLILYATRFIHYKFTKKIGLGLGDIKLLTLCAMWFGFFNCIFLLFSACLAALFYILIKIIFTNHSIKEKISFGPFILLASYIVVPLEVYLNFGPHIYI